MAQLSKRIENVSNEIQKHRILTVWGYIRNAENSLGLSHIPPLVTQLCLKFYPLAEGFDLAREDCFEISDDKLSIQLVEYCDWRHTVYCQRPIHSQSKAIIKWTFESSRAKGCVGQMSVGLAPNTNCLKSDFCCVTDIPNYSVYDGGLAFKDGQVVIHERIYFCHRGKAVILLDLFRGIFAFKRKDGKYRILFKDIERSEALTYRMAVQWHQENDTLSLTDFCISYDEKLIVDYVDN